MKSAILQICWKQISEKAVNFIGYFVSFIEHCCWISFPIFSVYPLAVCPWLYAEHSKETFLCHIVVISRYLIKHLKKDVWNISLDFWQIRFLSVLDFGIRKLFFKIYFFFIGSWYTIHMPNLCTASFMKPMVQYCSKNVQSTKQPTRVNCQNQFCGF